MATPNLPLRIMVDANVLIAGSVWPRFPYEVLRHALKGDYKLIQSAYVIAEAQEQIAASFPDNYWRFEHLLTHSKYELIADPSRDEVLANQNLVRDLKDVPVALAAINAHADFLVSQDRDFTDHDESTEELHMRLKVLLPGTFLREYMGWTSAELEKIRHRTWDNMGE